MLSTGGGAGRLPAPVVVAPLRGAVGGPSPGAVRHHPKPTMVNRSLVFAPAPGNSGVIVLWMNYLLLQAEFDILPPFSKVGIFPVIVS